VLIKVQKASFILFIKIDTKTTELQSQLEEHTSILLKHFPGFKGDILLHGKFVLYKKD
jgi:hypothetical protein